jgi:hypothetical protein
MAEGEISFEDILAEVTARTITVRVLLRQDLLDQHAALEHALEAAVQRDRTAWETPMDSVPEALAIARQIADLEAEIDEAKRPFTFKAVGRKAWTDLLAAHPPTKEQRAAEPRLDNNPDTFPPAAIAASCTSPKMTVADVRKFEELLDLAQFQMLWGACLEVNVGRGDTPKSLLAGGIARANAALGRQHTTTESLDPSSLDGGPRT